MENNKHHQICLCFEKSREQDKPYQIYPNFLTKKLYNKLFDFPKNIIIFAYQK